MKNNYRKLKFSILLQTVFVTAVTVLVGGFLLNYVIDGIYNDSFARIFVDFLTSLDVEEKTAIDLYWKLIGDNKAFFMVVGFLLLFALFFYVALSKMTKYLDQIGDGIENIVSDSTEPIHLITELKPIEIRLNEIKATLKRQELEAEEVEKKKNDLVIFLAHDLKTPLTSIVAYLSMLDSHPDMSQEEREKYTRIAFEKSLRLGELINEFFDITRYNLQNIELESVEINLSLMLEQLADELYGVLQEKQLACQVEVEENLVVYGDPDKLARVFDNILRNAIAYCYDNTRIQIEAQMKGQDVEIIFTNQGDKIPGAMLQTIFEKFYRVDGSRSSGTGGAGLGLAIAKQIVELHGGDEKHIPIQRNKIKALGYDYVALGHIHKPQMFQEEGAAYAGALEPIDKNDVGPHGYVRGEMDDKGCRVWFVPDAEREYVHMDVEIDKAMTGHSVRERIKAQIEERGVQNLYKITLKGLRDPDILFDLGDMDPYGNVVEVSDETKPAYEFGRLLEQNKDNLLGKFIESLLNYEKDSMEYQALCEGVQALMETRRG